MMSRLLIFSFAPIEASGTILMIELTRLNGNRLAVNSDLILCAESAPDTLLTMVTGEKLLVLETLAEIADRVAAYRARTLAEASRLAPGELAFGAASAIQARAAANANDASREEVDQESANAMRRRRRLG